MEVNLVSTTANMEEEVNLEANLEVKVEASDYILGKIQKLQNIFFQYIVVFVRFFSR